MHRMLDCLRGSLKSIILDTSFSIYGCRDTQNVMHISGDNWGSCLIEAYMEGIK